MILLGGIRNALATGVASFAQDTNVTLTSGDYVIVGGSVADSVTTNGTTTITVTITAGDTFTLTSANHYKLETDNAGSSVCNDAGSKSVLTLSPVSGAVTTIITPNTNIVQCSSGSGNSGSSGGGGGGVSVSTPTPTPTTSVSPTPTPTSTPLVGVMTPGQRGFVSLTAIGLKEGDTVSAAGSSDPDIYIPNVWGYKRLFLNPAIFNFYGHLGGFSKVKNTTAVNRDKMVTSGLFRNCETNDQKVYGVQVTGEDTGVLHWVNTTGAQAVADDANFFKKVFCINTNEFNWYSKGTNYTSVSQVPNYSR
ncbi:MAG: hypothetical protein V1709_03500 [Planctomycetota bacterium]